jgi:site-specific recombinase XerD
MGVNIWINRNQVYLDIYANGRRKREKLEGLTITGDKATDRETMRLAKIAEAKRAQQVFSEEWGLTDPVAGKQTLLEYASKLASKRPPNDSVCRVIKYIKAYPGGEAVRLGQVNEKWVSDFQDYLLNDNNLKASSAETYSSALRVVFNRAVKDRILVRSPAFAVKGIQRPDSNRVFLSADEVQKMANIKLGGHLGKDVKNAFLFSCNTGLRISDLKTLKWGDIEHSPLQLKKRQKKTNDMVFIPLNDTAWKIINDGKIHNHNEFVFPVLAAIKHQYLTRIYKWAAKAGIDKKVGWHTARHTFAVQSLEAGGDIYTVSKLLGHRKLQTTQVYAKATDKMKRAVVEALPAVEIS